MDLFKKRESKFIPATCPKCSGNLEIDSNFEIAYCLQCGLKCVIDDRISKKRKLKVTTFDKIIRFYERQLTIHREQRQAKLQEIKEEEQKAAEWSNKYGWVFLVIFIVLMAFVMIMSFLEL